MTIIFMCDCDYCVSYFYSVCNTDASDVCAIKITYLLTLFTSQLSNWKSSIDLDDQVSHMHTDHLVQGENALGTNWHGLDLAAVEAIRLADASPQKEKKKKDHEKFTAFSNPISPYHIWQSLVNSHPVICVCNGCKTNKMSF